MEVKPRFIIGLGNPGKEYEKTYHNAGFLAIDYLNKHHVSCVRCQMLKTDVYMNQSGGFVVKTIKKNKIKPEELMIIHDDSDIELGKYKISFNRGSAGHNGVESIIKALKTKNFWRLRIGVGKMSNVKGQKSKVRTKASDFVLKKISKKDLEILEKVFEAAAKKI